jgi:hypothetical protein
LGKNSSIRKAILCPAFIAGRNNSNWIGYRSNGIVKFGLRGLQLIFLKRYSAKEGFPDIRIRSSAIDKKGNVIFGTRTNGLFIFSTKDNQHWHINSSKGLSANWIKTISVDDNNNIYLLPIKVSYFAKWKL